MTHQQHLDLLNQGVTIWNAWRINNPGTRPDLSEANLFGADLSGADLFGANLSKANLSKANLSKANLNRASLSGADLNGADLNGADLREANLNEANLNRADLNSADLNSAYLYEADLNGADLSKANLSGADLSGATLSGATLNEATLSFANLDGADLSGATLTNALTYQTHFDNIDLRDVKGLEAIDHRGPSHISTSTLEQSGGEIPEIFLKGAGVGANLIEYARSLFGKPIEYYTCFISYSSKDELFARRLHNDLQHEGVRCWFAPEDMDIGDEIRHRIEETIKLYDKLLLILSESSITSTWVKYEVKRALNKEPQGIPNVLYPVRVDRAVLTCSEEWARDIKSTRHIGNFENWTDPQHYEENFKHLLRALNIKKEQMKN